MIDWAGVAFNALWVLGAAIILAALSQSSYDARQQGRRLRERLDDPGPQMALSGGMLLIGLSLALLETTLWRRLIWGLLTALNAWQMVVAWQQMRS